MRRGAYALVSVVWLTGLAGCATPALEMKAFWQPQSALDWEDPRVEGMTLGYEDGSERHLDAQVVENLVGTYDRLLKATNVRWMKLALVDARSEQAAVMQAFMTKEKWGQPVIAVSLGLLDAIGDDADALAGVLSHEIAHALLGHSPDELRTREEKIERTRHNVPPAYPNAGPAIFALAVQVATTVHYRSLTREEERAADQHGLDLAVKAGFDPCGIVRALEVPRPAAIPAFALFSTHPGDDERRELANRYSRQVNKRDCPEPGGRAISRKGERRTPALAVQRAAEGDTPEGEQRYQRAMAVFRAGDLPAAVREIRSLADSGHAQAQARLAYWHFHGLAGLPKDEVESARWASLAASRNNAWAQATLGRLYQRGLGGLQKDESEALRLMRLSAQQGHPIGESYLGLAYWHGLGVEKDRLEAARHFKHAADKGEPFAQAMLGWAYWSGQEDGIPKDATQAVRFFRWSAEQGHPSGQAGLARMYYLGAGGLEKDDAEALRLNRLAAEQGSATAQNNLGSMRENGEGGLPPDLDEAVLWYRRAAAQGVATAKKNLKRLGKD